MKQTFPFETIGIVHSCFKEKFGVPRQPGLTPSAHARVELLPPFNNPEAVLGLKDFSHIWIVFVFHKHLDANWKPRVRPPRLGGNESVGVFATRSSFRPNPIGMSAVKLIDIEFDQGVNLLVSGHDLVDGTPVIDIKPYIRYADSLPDAKSAYAQHPPNNKLNIVFSTDSHQALAENPTLKNLIVETLALDPRPAYHQHTQEEKAYGMKILNFEVKFRFSEETVTVLSISPNDTPGIGSDY
ncbi:MAG: tRNA (N6-threonylcarbamoyladenosine(37)-N6)-methyltransferase TrmO [Gammaproteobacteria bacterium]|nr:tRNA (N6-threonylcarbamoyladenosine(37)-N6)-methyltransferase TrmO [Gammaproteobacteria bacterium]